MSIVLREPDYGRFRDALAAPPYTAVSAATWLESALVTTSRLGVQGRTYLDQIVTMIGTEIVAVDAAQAEVAYEGWQRQGHRPELQQLHFLRDAEHLDKERLNLLEKPLAKRAQRIVVRVGIAREIAKRQRVVGGLLDPPTRIG